MFPPPPKPQCNVSIAAVRAPTGTWKLYFLFLLPHTLVAGFDVFISSFFHFTYDYTIKGAINEKSKSVGTNAI